MFAFVHVRAGRLFLPCGWWQHAAELRQWWLHDRTEHRLLTGLLHPWRQRKVVHRDGALRLRMGDPRSGPDDAAAAFISQRKLQRGDGTSGSLLDLAPIKLYPQGRV